MSYKKLEIWNLVDELVVKVHKMTMEELPSFEMYEEGSQIRRSSKSTKSNIVEGYGRRTYKQDFIHFLIIGLASNDETIDHLENLFNTGSLKNQKLYSELNDLALKLRGKMNRFIETVKVSHNTAHEPEMEYSQSKSDINYPESNIEDQEIN